MHYVKTIYMYLACNIRNEAEGLRYRCFAHKRKQTDGRRLILHYIGIMPFFTAAIFKTIQNCG